MASLTNKFIYCNGVTALLRFNYQDAEEMETSLWNITSYKIDMRHDKQVKKVRS
jgi:hypothetical protein